jgi:type IV secretory pathway VirB10-like protein
VPDVNTRVMERDAPTARTAGAVDALAEERRRRQYESLFASSSSRGRRVGADTRDTREPVRSREDRTSDDTLERTADAVVRASRRAADASGLAPTLALPGVTPTTSPQGTTSSEKPAPPAHTPPIDPAGPTHRILEGTVIDGVLTNRLDGSSAAPVTIQVTNPIYSHRGDVVLIPAGAKVLGEARPVQNFGESRIAVGFHRLIFPNGSSVRLDGFKGLNQSGDNGLKDQVNNHYVTTFAVGAVTGLVTGMGQAVGNLGLGGSGSNRTTVITGGAGNGTSQAANQTLSRLSNRLPTVTIREGQRVRVYLTSDLELPAYPVR